VPRRARRGCFAARWHNPVACPALWGGRSGRGSRERAAGLRVSGGVGAQSAFASWSAETLKQRAQVAYAYRELLRRHIDELAGLIHEENGKTLDEARAEAVCASEVTEHPCSLPLLVCC